MKILYIHQYFKTPKEPGGTRSYWIARKLIEKGHHVTMLTSSDRYTENTKRQEIDGINVIYIKESYDQRMNVVRRLIAFTNFMLKATIIAFKQKDIDLVIATSTPLTIGFPALVLKKIKKVPYVFEVRDLWPEVPIQMGGLKNPLLRRLARWFEKSIYKNAVHVVALSPGMQEGVIQYIPKERTSMIPNMSKKDEFWPREKNLELAKQLGLDSPKLRAIHFGSLGLANGAMTIIESARELKDNTGIEFIFIGGGSTERELVEACERYQLNNVKFLGKFSMRETSEIVNICDISLVSFADIPILYTNSPNKLFDSLSAGKPVIVNSAGWTKDLVERYNCGYYVNPSKPNELADKLIHLDKHPELIRTMGEHARQLALTKFDKSILCEKFVEVIEKQDV